MSTANIAKRKSRSLRQARRLTAYAFLLPNILGFVTLTLIPIVAAFGLSFLDWDFANPAKFVGLRNFMRLARDSGFKISLKNTIYYSAVSVPLTIVFALFLAALLNQRVRGIKFFRTIYFFPEISSIIAVAVVWNMLYHPTMGPINSFLRSIGIDNPPGWTASVKWAMPAVILMSVWKQVGYYTVIFLAGLQGIPEQLYEAATIDGANSWQKFRYITLPMLSPTTFLVSILLVINSFKVFDQIVIMTDGGPGRATNVLVYYIYYQAFLLFRFGYASAIATVLFALVLIVTIVQFRMEKKWVHYTMM
ncbi:MAG TPA: sugar ABC transporter permease [Bacillota bacterium]|jgi:multiple sugar transport system permease protein|nr:sugar ABC transporter permease [Bacillota bacterium]HOB91174.1 sugar ABC transporter permease [Bacillota bacterium]HPZ54301.1 sugar ABC transporter permease [Bacillota bacterium]HQD17584.1 sugar ABC transporter permease [Bacillota bacterium]